MRAAYIKAIYTDLLKSKTTCSATIRMLIDPAEDRLRSEFEGVQRSYIPMHAIVRIDEVEKEGVAKITTGSGEKVTPFPMPMPKDKG